MSDEIIALLRALEIDHDVKILYACEAGSRAYNTAIATSDYDIRFIYVSPLKRYLALKKYDDTITIQKDNLDIQGWDLRKALMLAHKSNPSLFEWMHSPIVYAKEAEFEADMREVATKEFSRKSLLYHYMNMAKKNNFGYEENGKLSYLIHAVRAVLMIEVLLTDMPVTIEMPVLFKRSDVYNEEDFIYLYSLKGNTESLDGDKTGSVLFRTKEYLVELESKGIQAIDCKPDMDILERMFLRYLNF